MCFCDSASDSVAWVCKIWPAQRFEASKATRVYTSAT